MLKKNLCLILFTTLITLFLLPLPAHASSHQKLNFPAENMRDINRLRTTSVSTSTETVHIQQTTTTSTQTQSITPTQQKTPTPVPHVTRQTSHYHFTASTPTPKLSPKPTTAPKPTQKPTSTTTSSDPKVTYMMNAINKYRTSLGLSSVKTDSYTCNFAKIRAKEITTDFSHDGFNQRVNNHTLPYPSYSQITENIAMTQDYKQVVQLWINSPGHAENMRQDTPYVCVQYSGNYYAYEGWRP